MEPIKKKLIRTAAVPSSLYVLLNGQLKYLNQHFEVIGVASEGDLLSKTAKREGIRTCSINIERNISPLKDLKAVYQLYKFFKNEKPDIVHSITPKAGLLTMMAGYFAKVPYRMHTFTGLLFPTRKGPMKQILIFFDKLICFFATHLYPEGLGVKKDLENYNITSKPLKVIANGNVNGKDMKYYNPSHFTQKQSLDARYTHGILQNDVVFIYIGRLVNDKGINELVNSFVILVKSNPNCKLLIVGSYDGETDLLPPTTLKIIYTHEQIIYVGAQKDVRPFLALSNIFVFPSYREGFPNVVLEAGAMGLPAIVTDINGSNEIIVHEQNGLIIPSGNQDALLKSMQRLTIDKALVAKMKANARPYITRRYDNKLVWSEQLKEYEEIISNGNKKFH